MSVENEIARAVQRVAAFDAENRKILILKKPFQI